MENQMEFDFSKNVNENQEKLSVAAQYNIVASEENLQKLEKVGEEWQFGGVSVEALEELYSEKDEYWK